MVKQLLKCIMRAIIPSAVIYCISVAVLRFSGFEIMEILRDPAQQMRESSFLGFVSNIGTWMWVSSASICLFAAFTHCSGSAHRKELLLFAGILSMVLAVDDFFLIHDRYINEKICYLVYAVSGGALLVRHYKQILAIDPVAFFLSGILLALSILTDLAQDHLPFNYVITQFIEEGFKFTGGATWLYFCCRIASAPAAAADAAPGRTG